MSYCVNCGVKLSDYHEKCPICNTVVINPNIKDKTITRDYPDYRVRVISKDKNNFIRRITAIILTLVFFALAVIPVLINIMIETKVTWSLIPLISIILIWVGVALPFMQKKNTFFRLFTIDCYASTLYILLLNLIISSDVSWAKYVSTGIVFIWMIMFGIIKSDSVAKQFSITIYYIAVAIVFSVLYAYWIGDQTMLTGLFLPIYAAILSLFLLSAFIIKAIVHDVFGFVSMILSSVAVLAFLIELIVSKFTYDIFTFSWSFIVIIVILPLIITLIIISKSNQYKAYLSKKFHR